MKTVTCNGCFDGLHPGHLFFLGYCRAQGDELVVGINTDDYITRKKRFKPLYTVEKRYTVLMALGIVKEVIVFDEPNPSDFIRKVRPSVHCTGEEYGYDCPEAPTCKEIGTKLVLVPRTQIWSTSDLSVIGMKWVSDFMRGLIENKT